MKWMPFPNRPAKQVAVDPPLSHCPGPGCREGCNPPPLFDRIWYLDLYEDVRNSDAEPLGHYLAFGWKEGRSPHPLFHGGWYLEQNPALGAAQVDSLSHYLSTGWREGCDPHPLFDVSRYLDLYADVRNSGAEPLQHYLTVGWREGRSPHFLFDGGWYLEQNPDVLEMGLEPLTHYLTRGWRERRNPHIAFDISWYLARYPSLDDGHVEPLTHFSWHGASEGRQPHPGCLATSALGSGPERLEKKMNQLADFLEGGSARSACPEFAFYLSLQESHSGASPPVASSAGFNKTPDYTDPPALESDIRAIAIHLPQFHQIPENDAWWGSGFTEWTNVRRARPQYENHYQPHIPHPDIGYYDLSDPLVLEKQAAMARMAGLQGFCYYYYWFNGRRLLEKPIDRMLATGKPDFPFCFCWANENWTRAWDGGNEEILMAQEHDPESDSRFIRDLFPAFRDPRYIRIRGRPLLVVYRPGLFPDAAGTAGIWRSICRENGIGEIFLAYMEAFDAPEPSEIGFDAAVRFSPGRIDVADLRGQRGVNLPGSFHGQVADYREMATVRAFGDDGENIIPCVCPSWDNTARRMDRGHSWINANPENYHKWLSQAVAALRSRQPPDRRILFINAWNEWAEGNHLEPDEKYGYAYLNATRSALCFPPCGLPRADPSDHVLVIGQDAELAGSQILLLSLLEEWAKPGGMNFNLLLLRGGPLRSRFEALGRTLVLSDFPGRQARQKALDLVLSPTPAAILCNTVTNGLLLDEISSRQIPTVTYVHELQNSIECLAPGEIMASTLRNSDHFIAVSQAVRDNLVSAHGVILETISVIPGFIKSGRSFPGRFRTREIACELDLAADDLLIFGCGTADWHKGVDLFVSVATRVCARFKNAKFAWIGTSLSEAGGDRLAHSIAKSGLAGRIHFLGKKANPSEYFSQGHIFLLSSREDSFPLVALEAADAGLPIICFEGSGGMQEFVRDDCGKVVPFCDTRLAAAAILVLLAEPAQRESLGQAAQAKVRSLHDVGGQQARVAGVLGDISQTCRSSSMGSWPRNRLAAGSKPELPAISVVVPNYNYACHLEQRLESILSQTLRPLEILFLDDASTDDSIAVATRCLAAGDIPWRIIKNPQNSGSPFPQWKRGLWEAAGDLVWIAEADDYSDRNFLKLVASPFADPDVVLSYCQSGTVDAQGRPQPGYFGSRVIFDSARDRTPTLTYTDSIDARRWLKAYVHCGHDEIRDALGLQNTIPNVGATVVRRAAAREAVQAALPFKYSGDWCYYLHLARQGSIAFTPVVLNHFRRHGKSLSFTADPTLAAKESLKISGDLVRDCLLSRDATFGRILRTFLDYEWRLSQVAAPPLNQNEGLAESLSELSSGLENFLGPRKGLSVLVVLPGAGTGGLEVAGVRLANELAGENRVYLVNACPLDSDGNLASTVSTEVLLLEGRLDSTAHFRFCPESAKSSGSDCPPIRIHAISAMCEWLGVDMVVSSGWWADKLAYALSCKRDVPWFSLMGGCYEYLLKHHGTEPEWLALVPQMMERVTAVFYLHEKNLQVFDALGLSKPPLRLYHYSAPALPPFSQEEAPPFAFRDDEVLFCMCARGIEEKGWKHAVEATLHVNRLPPAQRGGKRAKLIVIGTGPYLDALLAEHAGDDSILDCGLHREPVQIMRHCHVGILPSSFVNETQPNALIEYMACGLAVLATDVGDIAGMIREGERSAGWIVRVGEGCSELAVAMAALMRDGRVLADLRANAPEICRHKFGANSLSSLVVKEFNAGPWQPDRTLPAHQGKRPPLHA